MKLYPKAPKYLIIASIFGALLAMGACAGKTVRLEGEAALEQAVEQAKTPADHKAVAAQYDKEAERLLQLAERHERLAQTYARTDNPKMAGDSARHCRNIARQLRESAEEMRSLARMHREIEGQ